MSGAIVTLELHGTVFFLSSSIVLGKIMSHLNLPNLVDQKQTELSETVAASAVELSPLLAQAKHRSYDPERNSVEESPKMAVKYLILDCERLQGIDATAARSAFLQLQNTAALHGITICYAGCTDKVSNFLKAHGALVDSNCMEFPNLNFALDWAETKLLNSVYSIQQESFLTERDEATHEETDARDMSFTKLGKGRKSIRKMDELTVPLIIRTMLGLSREQSEDLEDMQDYYSPLVLETNDFLFSPGDLSDEFFVLLEGQLTFSMTSSDVFKSSKGLIVNKGSFIGYVDTILERPRTFYAKANTRCVFGVFNKIDMARLEIEKTSAFCKLLQVVLKQCSLEVNADGLLK